MDNIKKAANMTTIIVFIVAFLLGYGTSARIVNRNRAGAPTAQETIRMDTVNSLADISAAGMEGINTIVTDDQPAGVAVAITVKIEKESWIAIHEDAGGNPGKILGAQIFPAGEHMGKIELLRGTEAGKKYYAMLHADNGDRVFDYRVDLPITNESEEPVTDAFTAIAVPAQ